MKHAYLIIAHTNWGQLEKLIRALDSENHDIFLHIDKKSHSFEPNRFSTVTAHSALRVYQKYHVYWGGYSVVQTELFLFEEASKYNYDYYHVISGSDLPLVSNRELDRFFEINHGMEFIGFDEDKRLNDPEISRRARYYHFLQNYRHRYKQKVFNEFFTFLERCLLLLQICLQVNRLRNCDWQIMYGSNWVSITDDLVHELLKHRNEIEKVFQWTNCADELFVQTIAYNCGFKDRIYSRQSEQCANMRFIEWESARSKSPRTFTISDYQKIRSSGMMFARKFSETTDQEIIDQILQERV